MTKQILLLPLLAGLFFLPLQALAQQQVAIPLTNPGEAGSLSVNVVHGSISVTGYEGQEVLINYSGDTTNHEEQETDEEEKAKREGLRRIGGNSAGFQASEDNNEVVISGGSPMQRIDFNISVPSNFSLNLSTVNGGELRVENINGEMEISNVNGAVILKNVSGSALVNTVNGEITAVFDRVAPEKPMAFTNLNGDIDVTLPAQTAMTAKMKSEWGEVFTDFEMDVQSKNSPKTSTEGDILKVSVNNWLHGSINGGGPEYLFKSMRGDIYIRKSN